MRGIGGDFAERGKSELGGGLLPHCTDGTVLSPAASGSRAGDSESEQNGRNRN